MLDNPIPVLLNPIPASEGECDSPHPRAASSRNLVRPSRSASFESSQPEKCDGVGRLPLHPPFESNPFPVPCGEEATAPPMAEE